MTSGFEAVARSVPSERSETLRAFIGSALRGERARAFAQRLGAPEWTYTSAAGMASRVAALAAALRPVVRRGDRVAIVARNRVDWLAAAFGILCADCVVVPIFQTLAPDQIEYIFRDSEAALCFVETEAEAERLRAGCPSAPRLIHFDGTGAGSLAAFAAAASGAAPELVPPAIEGPEADAMAVLIYTSGTTGDPKGVMLSHRNVISNVRAAAHLLPPGVAAGDAVVLSVLPFAHIYEFTTSLIYLAAGAQLYITQPEYLLDDVRASRPHLMTLVPRIFERLLAGIIAKAKAAGGAQARLVPWALAAGRRAMSDVAAGRKMRPLTAARYALARRLVLSKIKAATGLDRLECFASGSAPLHRDIALTFAGLGLPILEGYGLTETSPIVTASSLGAVRYGSVGKPLTGVSVRLAADGEILVKGPSVMLGYYRVSNDDAFDSEGWFRTGDIGAFDADGYLFITDRKKELFKTSTGKYVAPGRVEAALRRSPYVGQCFVAGDGRAHPVALVVPNWELVRRELALPGEATNAAVARRDDVHRLLQREAVSNTADLSSFERIRLVGVLPRDLTIEDGDLSPTLKIKRRVVERAFAALIEATYAGAKPS